MRDDITRSFPQTYEGAASSRDRNIYSVLFVACIAVSVLLHVAVDLARGSPWAIITEFYVEGSVLQ